MITVVFVITPGMLATSASWPADMLLAANQASRALCPDKPAFKLVTTCVEQVQPSDPFSVSAETTIDELNHVDLIYLPALWRNPKPILKKHTALNSWLQHHYHNGAIISGVGTGCCFMAEAGLLDHKPATTHWYYFDQFQTHYPLVKLKRQHFITQAGKLYCAASINSLADLTIHFIQQFHNKTVAQHVERHFSHEIRRAYETVSYFEEGNLNHTDEDILQIQLWIKNNLDKSINIANLAEQFNMSTRSLNRRFKEATGKSPLTYIQDIRITTASDLLQSSNLGIGDIAEKVGYDINSFSRLFRKHLDISPRQYRITVRAKLFHNQ